MAQKAAPGQTVSGDLHLTQPHERGVLLAVVDGLGHGPEASRAAIIAIDALRQQPSDSVHALTNRCHAALTRTRGVVMTLASFDSADRTITWCGIGNVEARLFRYDANGTTSPENALLRGGTVGSQLPVLYASVIPVYPGDVLILASDGIRPDYEHDVPLRSPPQRIADHIMQKYYKGTDDALVLVARFEGTNHAA
ncbi:MAG TPA: SpoIIE family protein phosphatase [Lacunisphaera sp.]|nr:SpoIIE family protein phosphatase [Lacunisphaera sp.]